MSDCKTCDEARETAISRLINKVSAKYKDTPFIKLVIAKTRNGKLGIFEETEEPVARRINPLPIEQYLYLVYGSPAR